MKGLKELSLPLAIALLLVLKIQAWYFSSLYHWGYEHTDLLPYVATLFAGAFIASATMLRQMVRGNVVLRILWFLVTASIILPPIKIYLVGTPGLELWMKAVLGIAVLAVGYLLAIRGSPDFWNRIPAATFTAFVIYPMTGYFQFYGNKAEPHITFSFDKFGPSPRLPENKVFIVFDEASPEALAPAIASLTKNERLNLLVSYVPAAGKNTINAIPAILEGHRFDGVTPCGATRLCSSDRSIDFADLQSANHNIDVVGFYHPYCDIRGLRSCNRLIGFRPRLPQQFFCTLAPFVSDFSVCEWGYADWKNGVENAREEALSASFWREGGTLYLHLPIPHPSMSNGFPSLTEEYSQNMHILEVFLDELINRLDEKFERNFLLVVTADHPLRTEKWCRDISAYRRPDCEHGLPANKGIVPLVAILPQNSPPPSLPSSDVGILSSTR